MKYFTLIPDYTGSCIQDVDNERVEIDELGLPPDLIREIESWHASYRKIIPLSEDQRLQIIKHIEELDAQGLKLSKDIAKSVPGGAKVRYYSEAKYQYIDDI